MRSTFDIPDGLFKKAKLMAVREGVSLKDLVTRALKRELAAGHGERDGTTRKSWEALRGSLVRSDVTPQDSPLAEQVSPPPHDPIWNTTRKRT